MTGIVVPEQVREAAERVRSSLGRDMVEQALALYDAGWAPAAIAKRIAVSRSTVLLWRRQSELPPNGSRDGVQRLPPAELARTVELYEKHGMTIAEIAEVVGRSTNAVNRRLAGAGVILRPTGPQPGTRPVIPDGFVSTAMAAEALGVWRETISRRATAGKIPGATRIPSTLESGPRFVWAIPRSYIEGRRSSCRRPRVATEPAAIGRVVSSGMQDVTLPAAPLAAWVAAQPYDETTLADRSGVPARRLYGIRTGEQKSITVSLADRLLTANDARLDDVWPDLDRVLGLEAAA